MFMPKLFIGIGLTNAFYTLRETYLHEKVIGGQVFREIRSSHHFNLSQDLDEAIAKATEDSERLALPLELNRERLEQDMRDIKRATAEQLETREKARLADIEYRNEMRELRDFEMRQDIIGGTITFGKFSHTKIADLPRDYATWLVKKLPEFEEDSLLKLLAEIIRDNYPQLILPEADKDAIIGTIGERMVMNVEVTRNYPVQSDFGTLYIITMVTDNKVCIISKSTSFYAEVGERLTIKATVKNHGKYKEQAQTQVQRIKKI